MDIGQKLRQARKQKSLSQMEIARRSRVSLATIQNIETGRANPAWSTLAALFDVLSLKVEVQQKTIDWPLLAALGCPLMIEDVDATPDPARLAETLASLDMPKQDAHLDDRERLAITAWLWALHDHYPSLWKQIKPVTRKWFESAAAPKSIKLRRLALSRLASYL
jgi:transcriptional regulator with XRE-family HTH domain